MADQGTRYGCANPADPEPYDPEYWCKKCAKAEYQKYYKYLENSTATKLGKPFWQMPSWAYKALVKAGWDYGETHEIKKII